MTTDRKYDIVIVGGGPAGLTAALYAGRARVRTVLLERGIPGGQLLNTEAIEDYPGFDHITGAELAERMAEQARKFGVEIEAANVTAIRSDGERKRVESDNGTTYAADFVILTAGGQPKKLGIPGEAEFQGRGVSQCAICDGAFFKEQDVAVVGGGDAAVEEAAFLTRYARKVYLIHRRRHFRAQAILVEAARKNPKIEIILDAVVTEVHGDESGVTGITVKEEGAHPRMLPVTGFFVFIGFQPNVQFFDHREHPKHDPLNFLITDGNMETSVPGVYAAGDVRSQLTRQITTAVGDATTAAIDAVKKLEARKHQLTPVPVDAYGESDNLIIPAH